MIKKYISKIWKAEGHEHIKTPSNEKVSFFLIYKDLPIGLLQLNDGLWSFSYTPEFKRQKEIPPLFDFPDMDKVYESKQLWPFFSYRIPGLSQPAVIEILNEEAIDKDNEVALLKKFGKFSIYNPFQLKPQF